ncbi:hypothetical protein UACE39S_02347 [Ureibacillus acetophenoni]|uniref:DUF378 domain-containing protein n=1 Tax=Ureibacillus sp. MALMAid1270 TaxID=3411629 RepID=UPI003BA6C2C7
MNTIYRIALTLVIIGAINWGLIGLFDFNLVAAIFGEDTFASNVVYALVGLAGLLSLPILAKRFEEDRMDDTEIFAEPRPQMEAGEEFEFTEAERRRRRNEDIDDDTIV